MLCPRQQTRPIISNSFKQTRIYIAPLLLVASMSKGQTIFRWNSFQVLELSVFVNIQLPTLLDQFSPPRTISQTMSSTRRLLVYIIPVTIVSFALNIPKFIEVKMNCYDTNTGTIVTLENSTSPWEFYTRGNVSCSMDADPLRLNPSFVWWYTISLAWHPTITTGQVII